MKFRGVIIEESLLTAFGYQSIGIGIGSFFTLLYTPLRKSFIKEAKKFKKDTWVLLSLNEVAAAIAQFSYSYAFTLAPAALVSVVGSAQPFFVLVYGLLLSVLLPHIVKEEIDKATIGTKVISILLIFFGIYLLYA
jgi:drug/metabolite transporter (DMT)-like permease